MTSLDRRDDARQEEAAEPGEVRRWRAFSPLAVAFCMTIVDLTIVNVALPTIGRYFPQTGRSGRADQNCAHEQHSAPGCLSDPTVCLSHKKGSSGQAPARF